MFFRLLLLLLFLSHPVKAQEDLLIKELLEDLVHNLPEDFDLVELTERLVHYKKHPINLNRTNADDLKNLFFLSPLQIANFCRHLTEKGKLIDVIEVQTIPGFDSITVRRLLPFVYINEVDLKQKITAKNFLALGENDLVVRYATLLEKQKGFSSSVGNRYVGTPEKMLLRYKYHFDNRIAMSVTLEKDAGEKIIGKTIDFLSANITISEIGVVKKLIVGDYSLQFGQGLTLWSGFGFGKGPDVTSTAKKDLGLRPYTSANEYAFFRGTAARIALSKKLEITAFWSLRKHDATITLNNEGNGELTTLNETGYHRTQTELANQHTVNQQAYGLTALLQQNQLNLGFVLYQVNYDKKFVTNDIPYRAFNFSGNKLLNTGLHYSYAFKNVYFFGEIAKSMHGGTALMNAMLISFSNQISGVFQYRNYQKNYHNFFNQPAAEAAGFNETGFYAGLNIYPTKKWMVSLYTDYFSFPWLKFGVDAPSQGFEALAQLSYTPSKTFKTSLRYKTELKQQNTTNTVPIHHLEPVEKQSLRMDINCKLTKILNLQHRIEVTNYQKAIGKPEIGYLIYQDMAFAPSNSKLITNVRLAYFNSASYNSRLYAYEDDILYNFSFGMYHGIGFRGYLNIKYKISKNLDIWLRGAQFRYKNVTSIGSGLDEINGNKKTEVKLQMRYQF
jgi:hypothetical protein